MTDVAPSVPPTCGCAASISRDRPTPDGPPRARDALFRRGAVPDPAVREAPGAILADVRDGGDAAVREATDALRRRAAGRAAGARPATSCAPPRDAPRRASERDALETRRSPTSAGSPRPSVPRPTRTHDRARRRARAPLAARSPRAGVYVPGGSAPYPSSLVMAVVPARVAGVGQRRRRQPGGPRRQRPPGPARRRRPARASTRSSSPAARRRSGRSPTACPTRASSRWT